MYGSVYGNYTLTICWIKKTSKVDICSKKYNRFFLNALQKEINDDNEKHLTCFVHLLDANFY